MKFKIRGMRRISMPAIRATIGCSSAALRGKVIGLTPCSPEGFKKRHDGRPEATRSRQPRVSRRGHNHHPAIIAATVIPETASEQEDQQDDDQNKIHKGVYSSAVSRRHKRADKNS